MRYNVATLRDAGLEARWARTNKGAPILVARDPQGKSPHQRTQWWMVDDVMWKAMQRDGVREGFDSATLCGGFFSV